MGAVAAKLAGNTGGGGGSTDIAVGSTVTGGGANRLLSEDASQKLQALSTTTVDSSGNITANSFIAAGALLNLFQVFAGYSMGLGSGSMYFRTGGTYQFTNSGTAANQLIIGDAGIMTYANVATAGLGVPAIYGSGRFAAQTAAKTIATFTPVADASCEVSANILVTTATTHSFTVVCTYTDEGNTSRTLTMPFTLVAGSAIVNTIANATGTVPYMGIPLNIRVKGGTAITIATTGTFTTVAYNCEATIRQLA